jgi:DNA mismatch repair protein MSH6
MAPRTAGGDMSTPKSSLKKSTSGSQSLKGQKSILGFFGKTPSTGAPTPKFETKAASQLTPAPSSDAPAYSSPIPVNISTGKNKENGLPSPASPLSSVTGTDRATEGLENNGFSSPTRKVRALSIYPSTPLLQNQILIHRLR